MSAEEGEKKDQDGSGKALDRLTSSIEVVIRYFMTGVVICGTAFLSLNDPVGNFDKLKIPLDLLGIAALIVGFCSFTMYRIVFWQIVDPIFWWLGSSAPSVYKSNGIWADEPFARFLLWRHSGNLPESLGGYLTFRWSVIHFVIIGSLAAFSATWACAEGSLIFRCATQIRIVALTFFVLAMCQFWFLLRVERDLCRLTRRSKGAAA